MIHLSKVMDIASRKDKNGNPVIFSLKYAKVSTGEIISLPQCMLTSSHHSGTMNIRVLPSNQIRKLILPLIIEINNSPVYI